MGVRDRDMSDREEELRRNPVDHVLYALHNLCITRPERSKTADEIAVTLAMEPLQVKEALAKSVSLGYVQEQVDEKGILKYHLSGTGILRVCATFT